MGIMELRLGVRGHVSVEFRPNLMGLCVLTEGVHVCEDR